MIDKFRWVGLLKKSKSPFKLDWSLKVRSNLLFAIDANCMMLGRYILILPLNRNYISHLVKYKIQEAVWISIVEKIDDCVFLIPRLICDFVCLLWSWKKVENTGKVEWGNTDLGQYRQWELGILKITNWHHWLCRIVGWTVSHTH